MLTSATIDGLKALRLHAMAAALADQNEQAGYAGLGFDERLGLLVDRELTDRASRRIQRSLKAALAAHPRRRRGHRLPPPPRPGPRPASWTSPRRTGQTTGAPS